MEVLYNISFEHKRIPKFMRTMVEECFLNNRHEASRLYNQHINEANTIWERTGKPFAFGDHLEDINPEYVRCITAAIQPYLDQFNKRLFLCHFIVDEYGNLAGVVPFIKDSRLTLWFEPDNKV